MIFRFSPFARRITDRTVLWGLVPGFVLVMVLLGMAGLVAKTAGYYACRS